MIKSRRIKWAGHVTRMDEGRNAFKILIVKPTERRLGRPRHRRENIKRMDLKELRVRTRNWVDSARDRDYWRALVNVTLNLRFP